MTEALVLASEHFGELGGMKGGPAPGRSTGGPNGRLGRRAHRSGHDTLGSMPQLVLLRHGQSQWNADNLFTGWYDVDLTGRGESEAREAGRLLAAARGLDLRLLHTSVLTRAIRTADLTLEEAGRSWLPVRRHWRLNERHYGALQGKNKKETAAEHGDAQVLAWRRSYATPPPPVEPGSEHHPAGDPRYRDVPTGALPTTECLADVVARVLPYWEDAIVPDLLAEGARGGAVLVVAHGNSLRALRKHLDGTGDEEIVGLEIPTGIPFVYELGDDLSVLSKAYLGDPEAAEAAAEAVRRQAG